MGFFRSFLRIEVDELWKIRPNKKVTDIMQSHVMDWHCAKLCGRGLSELIRVTVVGVACVDPRTSLTWAWLVWINIRHWWHDWHPACRNLFQSLPETVFWWNPAPHEVTNHRVTKMAVVIEGGAVVQRVRHLGLRSVGRGFKSCSRQRCVTTLGKLFTPMCLCHQAV